ncbi:hypothetical protein OAR16_00330 [bacterium]|nr:hypothetical protein [bacterium]
MHDNGHNTCIRGAIRQFVVVIDPSNLEEVVGAAKVEKDVGASVQRVAVIDLEYLQLIKKDFN